MTGKAQAETIFGNAIEIASSEERRAFLDEACRDDSGLRREVEQLVLDYFRAGEFLQQPVAQLSSPTTDRPVVEKPGARIGPYKLLQQIGEGGFGLVYMAEQMEPVRRKVALKIIKPGMDTREVVARFEAERQALALMDHPNIAKVLDGGATESGRPYFVMELVKGIPLTEFCDTNRLAMPERLQLFATVCRAVQHAHQKGVIHRDLKPSNIMVTLHDGRPVAKVIDFGVSKAISQQLTERTLFTAYGQMIGTPAYMSPEQAEMSGLDIDTRSDVYSLGVLLYELLTGSTPLLADKLRGAAYGEVQRIIREQEPPKPSTRLSTLGQATASVAACRATEPKKLGALVRGDLDWIVMRALAKDREERYETANGFANDIERFLSREPVEACPPSLGYKFRAYVRRNRQTLLVLGAIHGLLMAGIIVSVALAIRVSRERDRANAAQQLARRHLAEVEQQQKKTRSALTQATRERRRAETAERLETQRRVEAQKQKDLAQQQRVRAERQARVANARRLAARSREALHEHPELGLLLAVEALQVSRRHGEPTVPVAEQTLRDALATIGGAPLNQRGMPARVVATTSNWIVTEDGHATRLFDLSAPDPTARPVHLLEQRALSNRGDSQLVTVDPDRAVRVCDLKADQAMATTVVQQHPGTLDRAMVSPNGKWLATSTAAGELRLWDVAAMDLQPHSHLVPGQKAWAISPDSRWLATESTGGGIVLWDLANDDPTNSRFDLEMRGEAGELLNVLFGPSGRWLVVSSRNPTERQPLGRRWRVWELKRDRLTQPPLLRSMAYAGHRGGELFSPDGRWLLFPGVEFHLWDMNEKAPDVSPISLKSQETHSVFSPDSNVLVIGDRTWNLSDRRLEQRPRGVRDAQGERVVIHHAAPAAVDQGMSTCWAFDPEMRWCARALVDKRIEFWDLMEISQAPRPPRDTITLRGHDDQVAALEFCRDGRWLLSEGMQGAVRLWDLERKSPGVTPAQLRGEIADSVSPDGRWLVTSDTRQEPRSARLWDLTAPDPTTAPALLTGHAGTLREAAFSPDSRWLVTVDQDVNMHIWDLTSDDLGAGVRLFRPGRKNGGVQRLFQVAFSADSRWLYAAPGLEARLWDLESEMPGNDPLLFEGYTSVPTVATLSAGGRWLFTADRTSGRLWDLAADDPTADPYVLGENPAAISFATFDSEGRRLITVEDQAKAPTAWDLTAANPAASPTMLAGHRGALTLPPAVSRDRRWLATSGADKDVRVWDLDDHRGSKEPLVLSGGGELSALEFSPDSRWLFGNKDNQTRVWDLSDDDSAEPAAVIDGSLLRVSPDSRWFVAGEKLWRLTDEGVTESPLALAMAGESWRVVEFSSDGHWLAVYGAAKVGLFDLSAEQRAAIPTLLTGALRKHTQVFARRDIEMLPMPFSADGRWLVGCSYSGAGQPNTLLFHLRIDELIEVARRTAGRRLTAQEVDQFSIDR